MTARRVTGNLMCCGLHGTICGGLTLQTQAAKSDMGIPLTLPINGIQVIGPLLASLSIPEKSCDNAVARFCDCNNESTSLHLGQADKRAVTPNSY